MATARRTGTSENVSTFGGSGMGRDYTSVSTWEAATDNDLVATTTSEVLECYDDAASFNQTWTIDGATTNSTYMRIMRPASGQGHDGTSNNGVTFSVTTFNHIQISEANFKFQDLILTCTHDASGSRTFVQNTVGDGCELVGLIIFDCVNNGTGVADGLHVLGAGTRYVIDCLFDNAENFNARGDADSPGFTYFYNCTSVDAGSYGFEHRPDGEMVCKNCLAKGNSPDFDTGLNSASNFNASGDTSAPGANSRVSQTFTFTSEAGNDFHLAVTDAGARNFGTNLSADANFAFDDDIDKQLFNVWDIGFDEPEPAGAPSGRIMGALAGESGLAGVGGLAGKGGGLAG